MTMCVRRHPWSVTGLTSKQAANYTCTNHVRSLYLHVSTLICPTSHNLKYRSLNPGFPLVLREDKNFWDSKYTTELQLNHAGVSYIQRTTCVKSGLAMKTVQCYACANTFRVPLSQYSRIDQAYSLFFQLQFCLGCGQDIYHGVLCTCALICGVEHGDKKME